MKEFFTTILSFLDKYNGVVTATATVVIAIFTIVLAFVTRRQAGLTKDAAEAAQRSAAIAERALVDLERPYLVVEITSPGISVDLQGNFSFAGERPRWAAINHGRTPALLIDRITAWPIEAGGAMPSPIDPMQQQGHAFPAGCVSSADRPYDETANLMAEADIQTMLVPSAWRNHRIFLPPRCFQWVG
jgi:hypothetical protein